MISILHPCPPKTIVYKGMLTPGQLRDFYLDLSDLDFTSALAMVPRFYIEYIPKLGSGAS